MRQGMFPGQLEALRALARKGLEAERKSRRQMLAAGIGVVAAAFAGFALGRGWRTPAEPVAGAEPANDIWHRKIAWAERYARSPIDELVANRSTFLMTLEQTGGTERMWMGFARLADHAIGASDRRELAGRLLVTARLARAPASVAPLTARLSAFLERR